MSRRQHVVRTDDQGGVGSARSLAGCRVLCATQDCGDVYQGDQSIIAAIPVTSNRTYQRCFVSATIGHISAAIPDPPPPPGPGSWSVRFERNNPTGEQYYSGPYYEYGAESTITSMSWGGIPLYQEQFQFEGIQNYDGLWWQDWLNIINTGVSSGTENPDPPVPVNSKIRMALSHVGTEPAWIDLTLSSPYGEGTENVVISDG